MAQFQLKVNGCSDVPSKINFSHFFNCSLKSHNLTFQRLPVWLNFMQTVLTENKLSKMFLNVALEVVGGLKLCVQNHNPGSWEKHACDHFCQVILRCFLHISQSCKSEMSNEWHKKCIYFFPKYEIKYFCERYKHSICLKNIFNPDLIDNFF